MKFSICIPNYNYAAYIRKTIDSALRQSGAEVEVVVRDNVSTDDSVAVVRAIDDPRVRIEVNACNVGFAGNLDKVVEMATGDRIIMLSSDDLLRPGILSLYEKLFAHMGAKSGATIISSSNDLIDGQDRVTGLLRADRRLFHEGDRDPVLKEIAGAPVYRVAASELLRRSLDIMANPFHLSSTAYPRSLYAKVEGYGGSSRNMNPDKWFHWRLMGAAQEVLYVDAPLAASRWHQSNQTAQQSKSGALKYLVDEYMTTWQLDGKLLERLGLTRTDLEQRFVEYDIARHGLATLASGDRAKARRIVQFGQAAFPSLAMKNQKVWALKALLAAGPLGDAVSRAAYKAYGARSPRGKRPLEAVS